MPAVDSAFTAPAFGAVVTTSTTGFKPTLSSLADYYVAKWEGDSTSSIADDILYAVPTDSVATVAAGHIRLAKGASALSTVSAGAVVGSGDADVGKTLEDPADGAGTYPLLNTLVEFLELDAVPGFTVGDGVYLDFGGTMENCAAPVDGLSTCDVRLATRSTPSTTAGTYVVTGDADLVESGDTDGSLPDGITTTALTLEALHYYDVNEGGTLDAGDVVYLRAAGAVAPPTSFVTSANSVASVAVAGDLKIAGSGFGTFASTSDHVPVLITAPTNRVVCTTSAGAACSAVAGGGAATDRIILDFGAGSVVKLGSLSLNTASGMTAGSFITTTAAGLGGAFTATTALGNHLFYVDLAPTGQFGEEDPVYLNRHTGIGGTADALAVSANDIRIHPATGSSAASFAVGSVVAASDADATAYSASVGVAVDDVKVWDADRGQAIGTLRNLNLAKLTTTGTANVLDAGDDAYIDTDNNNLVTAGDIRIVVTGFTAGTTVAAADSDCTACTTTATKALQAFSAGGAKVTGSDGSWSSSTEWVYHDLDSDGMPSLNDLRLTASPHSLSGLAARSTVATNDADVPIGTIGTGDSIFGSTVAIGTAAIPLYPDVRILSTLGFGTRVVEGNADHTPRVLSITQNSWCQSRSSRGTDSLSDDAFYASTDCDGTPVPTAGDARLTPVTGFTYAAGTIVAGGDTDTQSITNTRVDPAGNNFWETVMYWNPSGGSKAASRYDSGDAVVMNNEVSGTTADTVDQNDVRLRTTAGGAAGTIILNGHTDITQASGGQVSRVPAAGLVFIGKFLDKDQDGTYDVGEHLIVSADDADCTTPACSGILKLGDLFLTGSGGGAGSVSTGGGGGSTVVTTTTSTTSGSVTSSTSASVTDSSTSGTGTDSGTFTTGTGTDTGTGTGDGDGGGDNSTPGLGFAVLVFALAAAVLVARRKL